MRGIDLSPVTRIVDIFLFDFRLKMLLNKLFLRIIDGVTYMRGHGRTLSKKKHVTFSNYCLGTY